VILIAGGMFSDRGKFYAGIARAAYKTDAVVIDSGIHTGIEPFCIRKNIKLIGVCPGNQIKYPKVNLISKDPYQLSKGHTHIFLTYQQGNEKLKTKWGDEAEFKLRLAHQIKTGLQQQKYSGYKCKSVMVVMGENSKIFDDPMCGFELSPDNRRERLSFRKSAHSQAKKSIE